MNTITDESIARETARLLLQSGAVVVNTQKPFRYVSGIYSPMYTDNRVLMSHPYIWHKVLRFFSSLLKKIMIDSPFDVLSGTATAAIPHTAALAYSLRKPMVYVRSSKKDHGKENQIEGMLKKGDRVIIIEDLISTGSSVATNAHAIRTAGGSVSYCLAITTSTLDAYVSTMKSLNIQLITLTDVTTVLKEAVDNKYMSSHEEGIVRSFLLDPSGWGAKMGFTV